MNVETLKSGQSLEGQEIKAYQLGPKADQYLYLIAGVHGDEVEGVYVLDKIFQWLKECDDQLPSMILITCQNMDGYKNRTRTNSHGVDLNSNFPTDSWTKEFSKAENNPGLKPLSEPENQFLVKLFKKYSPQLLISFHSWKPILNYNGNCRELAEYLHSFNQYPVQSDIGYPTPGSLGTYAPKEWDCPVLTYECPRINENVALEEIWLENEKGLKSLLLNWKDCLKLCQT